MDVYKLRFGSLAGEYIRRGAVHPVGARLGHVRLYCGPALHHRHLHRTR